MLLFLYCPSGKCLSEYFRSQNKVKFKLTETKEHHQVPETGSLFGERGQGSLVFKTVGKKKNLSSYAILKFIPRVILKSFNDLPGLLLGTGVVVAIWLLVERFR